jgi:hypothetical protein
VLSLALWTGRHTKTNAGVDSLRDRRTKYRPQACHGGGRGVEVHESLLVSDSDSDLSIVAIAQKCKSLRNTIHSGNHSDIYIYAVDDKYVPIGQ